VSINEGKRRKRNCLRKIEVEEELRRAKRKVLNIQPLAVKSPSHSSSSSECVEGKAYNERI
jgi:hypothetical protein